MKISHLFRGFAIAVCVGLLGVATFLSSVTANSQIQAASITQTGTLKLTVISSNVGSETIDADLGKGSVIISDLVFSEPTEHVFNGQVVDFSTDAASDAIKAVVSEMVTSLRTLSSKSFSIVANSSDGNISGRYVGVGTNSAKTETSEFQKGDSIGITGTHESFRFDIPELSALNGSKFSSNAALVINRVDVAAAACNSTASFALRFEPSVVAGK